jgi:hypothetical protein
MASKIEKTNSQKAVTFSFRLNPVLAEQLKARAKTDRRSCGQTVVIIVEEALKEKTA